MRDLAPNDDQPILKSRIEVWASARAGLLKRKRHLREGGACQSNCQTCSGQERTRARQYCDFTEERVLGRKSCQTVLRPSAPVECIRVTGTPTVDHCPCAPISSYSFWLHQPAHPTVCPPNRNCPHGKHTHKPASTTAAAESSCSTAWSKCRDRKW